MLHQAFTTISSRIRLNQARPMAPSLTPTAAPSLRMIKALKTKCSPLSKCLIVSYTLRDSIWIPKILCQTNDSHWLPSKTRTYLEAHPLVQANQMGSLGAATLLLFSLSWLPIPLFSHFKKVREWALIRGLTTPFLNSTIRYSINSRKKSPYLISTKWQLARSTWTILWIRDSSLPRKKENRRSVKANKFLKKVWVKALAIQIQLLKMTIHNKWYKKLRLWRRKQNNQFLR